MRTAVAKQTRPHPHRGSDPEGSRATRTSSLDGSSPIPHLQRTAGNRGVGQLLQAKLAVNTPGDAYEREADRTADQMLATPAHSAVSNAPPNIQRYEGQSAGQKDTALPSVDRV
jgi:hypothetical protein